MRVEPFELHSGCRLRSRAVFFLRKLWSDSLWARALPPWVAGLFRNVFLSTLRYLCSSYQYRLQHYFIFGECIFLIVCSIAIFTYICVYFTPRYPKYSYNYIIYLHSPYKQNIASWKSNSILNTYLYLQNEWKYTSMYITRRVFIVRAMSRLSKVN